MKRNILIAALCLVAATGLQAQILIKHNGEKLDFTDNKLVKIVFEDYQYNDVDICDNILFVYQSGDTLTFDIDAIYTMGFAEDFTQIEKVQQSGAKTIVYDADRATIHIANAKDEGTLYVFNADGKLARRIIGNTTCIADLPDGLYIVSYNQVLNAKIVKK